VTCRGATMLECNFEMFDDRRGATLRMFDDSRGAALRYLMNAGVLVWRSLTNAGYDKSVMIKSVMIKCAQGITYNFNVQPISTYL